MKGKAATIVGLLLSTPPLCAAQDSLPAPSRSMMVPAIRGLVVHFKTQLCCKNAHFCPQQMHAGLALDLVTITRQAGNIPSLTYAFSLADRQGASIEEMMLFYSFLESL